VKSFSVGRHVTDTNVNAEAAAAAAVRFNYMLLFSRASGVT